MSFTPSALAGVVAILVTPFTDDDRLDLPGLERVVEHMIGLGAYEHDCILLNMSDERAH